MLDGELATKLERAVTNENSIVALSIDDRHRIVAALGIDGPVRTRGASQRARHAAEEAR